MKKVLCFLTLILLSVSLSLGQTKTGTLKIFTEVSGTVTYLNDVKQDDNVKVINDVPVGSHYLKVLSNGTVIYSEIVEIKEGQITTVLIKNVGNKVDEKTVVRKVENTGVVTYNPNPSNVEPPINKTNPTLSSDVPETVPLVNIGQVDGKLSADISGVFGLTWGMNENTAKDILVGLGGSLTESGHDYVTYTMDGATQKPFMVECRWFNGKLFQILIGYVSIDYSKQKVDKYSIPLSDYNEINETLLQTYGQPTSSDRTFTGGYKEGDGREVEAIKKHQANIVTTWDLPNGNEASLRIVCSSAILVLVAYQDGVVSKEAHVRKIKIHNYQY